LAGEADLRECSLKAVLAGDFAEIEDLLDVYWGMRLIVCVTVYLLAPKADLIGSIFLALVLPLEGDTDYRLLRLES